MENKNIDTTLNTLRKHSPNWIDEIRNNINRLEKALTSQSKQIEDNEKAIEEGEQMIEDRDKIIDNLKSQLQKKDNIIKGMNQIIQKKTLTKEQVFGKDKLPTAEKDKEYKELLRANTSLFLAKQKAEFKLQTQRDDMDKFIRLLEIDLRLLLKKGDKLAVNKLSFVIEHLKQKTKHSKTW